MQSEEAFPFNIADVVLVDWGRKLYYAKILSINHMKSKCRLLFDDGSCGNAHFGQIHNVNETTADIHCVVCKDDSTSPGNEIVLCDSCSVGYHQKCHSPGIPANALEYFTPWICSYCSKEENNPHIEKNPFEGNEEDKLEDNDIHIRNGHSVEETDKIYQKELHDREVDCADSDLSMKEEYEKQAENTRKHTDKRYESNKTHDKELIFSKKREKKAFEFNTDRKRSHQAFDRYASEISSFYRRSSFGSFSNSRSESLKRRWGRRNRNERMCDERQHLRKRCLGGSPNRGAQRVGISSSHVERYNTRNCSRGPKQQGRKLRDKLVKHYVPNQYLFGFSNKNHTRDFAKDRCNDKSREITRMSNEQKRSNSCDEWISIESDYGEVKQRHNEPWKHSSKQSGSLCKKIKFDNDVLYKLKARDNEKQFEYRNHKRSAKMTSDKVSEKIKELKDDMKAVVQSSVHYEPEAPGESHISKTLKSKIMDGSQGNEFINERTSEALHSKKLEKDYLENKEFDNNCTKERSAFKYVKRLLTRPGSSIKHQEQLLIDYKTSPTNSNNKVAQCKHSDAAEVEKECVNNSIIKNYDIITLNGEKEKLGGHEKPCSIKKSMVDNSTFSSEDGATMEGIGDTSEISGVRNHSRDLRIEEKEERIIIPVTDDTLSLSATKKEDFARNERETIEDLNFVSISGGTWENKEARRITIGKKKIIDEDFIAGRTIKRKTQSSDDAKSLSSLKEINRNMVRSSDARPPSLRDKVCAAECNSTASEENSSDSGTKNGTILSGGLVPLSFEKINCHGMNGEDKEVKKTEPGIDVDSKEPYEVVECSKVENKMLSSVEREYLISTRGEETMVEYGNKRMECLINAKDTPSAPALSNEISIFLTEVQNDKYGMESGRKCSQLSNHRSKSQEIEQESVNCELEFVCDKTQMKKDVSRSDMDAKSSLSENRGQNSFTNALFEQKAHFSSSLPSNSSRNLVVEWGDCNNGGSSLGICISDVFSLQKEKVDGKTDEPMSVLEDANCKKGPCLGGIGESCDGDITDHAELESDGNESERSLDKKKSLKKENLEVLVSSEKSGSVSCCVVVKEHKEQLEIHEEMHNEESHSNAADSIWEREKETSDLKVIKDAKKGNTDDHQSSIDGQPDQSTKRKRKKRKLRAVSSTSDVQQTDRILLDLPRHNWLIERLLSEKKLDSDTIEEENPPEKLQYDENIPKGNKRKKRSDRNSKLECGTGKLTTEELKTMGDAQPCKGIDAKVENDDFPVDLMKTTDRFSEAKTRELKTIEGTSIELINAAVPSRSAAKNNENPINCNDTGAVSSSSLVVPMKNFSKEKRETAAECVVKRSALSELGETSKSDCKACSDISSKAPSCCCGMNLGIKSSRNDKEQSKTDEKPNDLTKQLIKGEILQSPNTTVKENGTIVTEGTKCKSDFSFENANIVNEIFMKEKDCRNEENNEIEQVDQLVGVEKQSLNKESSCNSNISIDSRSVIANNCISSWGPYVSMQEKDRNNHDENIIRMMPQQTSTEKISRCSTSALSNSSSPSARREFRMSRHERLELSVPERTHSQTDVPKYSHPVPPAPVTANAFYCDSKNHHTHSTSVHLHSNVVKESKCEPSILNGHDKQFSLVQYPEASKSLQKVPVVDKYSNICSSHTPTMLSNEPFVQAKGNFPLGNDNQAQKHVQALPHHIYSKKHTAKPILCNIDSGQKSSLSVRLEVNDNSIREISTAISCDINQKRQKYLEKSEIDERDRNKRTLDEKAKIILGIIEDKSISESTKQELVGYWRSLRNMSSHSRLGGSVNSEIKEGKGENLSNTTGGRMSDTPHSFNVSHITVPFYSSIATCHNTNPLSTTLDMKDNQCKDWDVKQTKQFDDVLRYPNVSKHFLARNFHQRLSPILTRHYASSISNLAEIPRKGEVDMTKRSSSDPVFMDEKIKEMHWKQIEMQEKTDSPRYSSGNNLCLPRHKLHPEDSVKYTSLSRKNHYEHVYPNIHDSQRMMSDSRLAPLLVNREEDKLRFDKSPNPDNIKKKTLSIEYSRRISSFNEREMSQRDEEYLKRNQVNGKYGECVTHAHPMKEHLPQREREKLSIDAPHDFIGQMQHFNNIHRAQHLPHQQRITQQQEQWQPRFHHRPLLPEQHTEHLKQPLLQQQLYCRGKWQTELQMCHFKQQEELQPPQRTVQKHPQLAEQKICQKQQGLQHQYRFDQLPQQEGIMKQKEPYEMKKEHQKSAWQKIDELRRPSDERPLGKHDSAIEQEQFYLRQYQQLKLFKRQPITERSEKSVEDKFIGSPNRSCFKSGAQLQVYEPPHLQSPLRSHLPNPNQNHRGSRSLGDKMHQNHSQIPFSQVQLKARDTSPSFETSKISGRSVAKFNSDGHNVGAICQSCGKKAMFLCSRCMNAWYCSNSCQFKEWKEHCRRCKRNKNGMEPPKD